MSSIFNVNFSNVWASITPPKIRQPRQLAIGTVLLKPLQYLRNLVFDDFVDGSTYADFNITSAYTSNDRVIYNNRGVYENITGCTGILPTDINNWNLINENYLGVRERVKYNAQKILFEYGLNRWFQCSGIYISNNIISTTGLLMGNTSDYSSLLSELSVPTSSSYLINTFSGISTYDYTIYVPTAVYSGLGTTYIDSENNIRSFADKYNLAGMSYNVVAY